MTDLVYLINKLIEYKIAYQSLFFNFLGYINFIMEENTNESTENDLYRPNKKG